ncbi:hypothetical protein LDENG_00122330 [Lucifuga dentata]|nr:hypothetical protein LDENG_00122330 [Lucifuga dentata]
MLSHGMLGLLMVLVLLVLGDADSTCPVEPNPLTLGPPKLVGEYGMSYKVNCSSTFPDHYGMYWTDGSGEHNMTKGVVLLSELVSLSDWNGHFQCNIKLNKTHECSKDLSLTVYQNPDSVVLYSVKHSHSMEEGTQHELQCDIINVAPVQNLKVKWYKDNQLIKTDSFTNTTKTPLHESSTFMMNLSREDNRVQLRCEAQLDFGSQGPQLPRISSEILNIYVHYKPIVECQKVFTAAENNFNLTNIPCNADANPPADVKWYHRGRLINASEILTRNDSGEYHLQATNHLGTHNGTITVTVQYAPEFKSAVDIVNVDEGKNVSLDCEAEGNPPPTFQWIDVATGHNLNMSEIKNYLHLQEVKTSMTYDCIAKNLLGNRTKRIYVNVRKSSTAATTTAIMTTQMTTVCPLKLMPAKIVVRYGDPASANCSTSSTNYVGMGWEASLGSTGILNTTSVTWKVEKLEDWTMEPKCYITLNNDDDDDDDHQCKKILKIILYKTPDIVSASLLDHVGPLVEGAKYQLECNIINVAPIQNLKVKWYKDNEIIETRFFNDHHSRVSPGNESSSLGIIPRRDDNNAKFRCEAQLDFGPDGPQLVSTKTSEPYIADVHYMPLIDCPSNYSGVEHRFTMDMVPCRADGKPTPTVNWYYQEKQINALMLLSRTHLGKYIFEAVNTLGRVNTSVDITVEYGPSINCHDHHEVEENSEQQPACKIEGRPNPLITWNKDGKKVIPPKRWKRHHSGEYFLSATNKHGTADHTLHVNVLYAPEFKQADYTVEVITNENVSLVCSAEGNPSPSLYWSYTSAVNMKETTGGGQKNISVIGAMSTNAGVYICLATNKLGNVTSSVTLVIRDHTNGFPTVAIWVIMILVLVICIVIFMVICRNCRKKHGQYNVLPVRFKDGSETFPMTLQSDSRRN